MSLSWKHSHTMTHSAAISVILHNRLNELAAGDFRRHAQVKALFAFDKATLHAFDAFRAAYPKRFAQLEILTTYPREGHKLVKERRALVATGVLHADFGLDWYVARFEGRGLVKVLRSVGLLTAELGRDLMAGVYNMTTAVIADILKHIVDAGFLEGAKKEDCCWAFTNCSGEMLTRVLVAAGHEHALGSDADCRWFQCAYRYDPDKSTELGAACARRCAINRLFANPSADFMRRNLFPEDLFYEMRRRGLVTSELSASWYAEAFRDCDVLLFDALTTAGLMTADLGEEWIVDNFESGLHRAKALVKTGFIDERFDYLDAVFGDDKFGLQLILEMRPQDPDYFYHRVSSIDHYRKTRFNFMLEWRCVFDAPMGQGFAVTPWCSRTNTPDLGDL